MLLLAATQLWLPLAKELDNKSTKHTGTLRMHTRYNDLLSVQLHETGHVTFYSTNNNGVKVYSHKCIVLDK